MGMIKTKKEVLLLKKAASISNSCIELIRESLREKMTERELARRIRRKINQQGGTLSFQTLVASGQRTSMIHPKPHATNKIISGLGYVDFGAAYRGYKADVTVPFIKGKISREEKKIVNLVLSAYNLAVKSVKVEEPCWRLHDKIDKFLNRNGYGMQHSLGHGIGLKVL